MTQNSTNVPLNILIQNRGQIKAHLTRFQKFLDSFELLSGSIIEIQKRLDKIETLWDKFNEYQFQIEVLDTSEEQDIERENFESTYIALTSRAQQIIEGQSLRNAPSSNMSGPSHASDEFNKFITTRCQTLENVYPNANQSLNTQSHVKKQEESHRQSTISRFSQNNQKSFNHFTANRPLCNFCKEHHFIYHCDKFLKLPIKERYAKIKKLKLCLNCPHPSHTLDDCISEGCRICHKKHNTLLHHHNESDTQPQRAATPASSGASGTAGGRSGAAGVTPVILSTALIHIFDKNNKPVLCRCLLDSGSQSNFISKDMAKTLGLKSNKINLPIIGINRSSSTVKNALNIRIKSLYNEFSRDLNCLVLDEITGNIPHQPIHIDNLPIPENLALADPKFNQSQRIDCLLGVLIFYELTCIGQIKLGRGQPILQMTHLGWVILGPISNYPQQSTCLVSLNSVYDQL
nr:unnamed protein product [Callosobruchus analis]